METNKTSLDTLCAALCYAMGVEPPAQSNPANETLKKYVDEKFKGQKADRIFMYNPDAVGQWIFEKYPQLFTQAMSHADIQVPYKSVMPSVTPVCFGTMYTGAQPSVHGIQKYEKPVIKIDTIFDALIRAGKKPVIVAQDVCSMGKIYLERDMDYYLVKGTDEANAIAAELLLKDEHDFYAIYNGNFDNTMHKTGTESVDSLSEIRANSRTFAMYSEMIKKHWKGHNTLAAFAMDHGCHEDPEGGSGSHGLDTPEDLNIVHLYKAHPKSILD